MEIKPATLVALCVITFVGIVAINLVTQMRGNEEVKQKLQGLDLSNLRPRLVRQENMEPDLTDEPEVESPNEAG